MQHASLSTAAAQVAGRYLSTGRASQHRLCALPCCLPTGRCHHTDSDSWLGGLVCQVAEGSGTPYQGDCARRTVYTVADAPAERTEGSRLLGPVEPAQSHAAGDALLATPRWQLRQNPSVWCMSSAGSRCCSALPPLQAGQPRQLACRALHRASQREAFVPPRDWLWGCAAHRGLMGRARARISWRWRS